MTKLIIAGFSILILLLIASSCKTTKYTPTDFPDQQITFGSGGGFSGIVTDYTLLGNGQIFKRSSIDNRFEELKRVKKNATKQALKNYVFLGVNEMTTDAPGNLYYFIQYKDKDNKEHKVVWGDGKTPEEEKLKTYYSLLASLLPKK